MKQKKMLSIIVTVYNMEKYINQCIDSILNQTYSNLEIVIIDDGSTDNSPCICDSYAHENSRIKVIHQENAGIVSARNRGIRETSGEYIGFVDGDDWIEPNMYSEMMQSLIESNADFIDTGYIEEYGNKSERRVAAGISRIIVLTEERKQVIIEHILRPEDAEDKIYPSHWSKIYKRKLLENVYYRVAPSAFLGEDLVNLLLCIYEADSVCLLREAYYHYRYRNTSMVHFADADKLYKIGDLFKCIKMVILDYGGDLNLQKIIREKYVNAVLDCLDSLIITGDKIYRYYYDSIDDIRGKKVVLYGAGAVGKSYYNQFAGNQNFILAAWVDRNYLKLKNQYNLIESPENIQYMEYDIILIALLEKEKSQMVMNDLIKMGIPLEKIIWRKPKLRFWGEMG